MNKHLIKKTGKTSEVHQRQHVMVTRSTRRQWTSSDARERRTESTGKQHPTPARSALVRRLGAGEQAAEAHAHCTRHAQWWGALDSVASGKPASVYHASQQLHTYTGDRGNETRCDGDLYAVLKAAKSGNPDIQGQVSGHSQRWRKEQLTAKTP